MFFVTRSYRSRFKNEAVEKFKSLKSKQSKKFFSSAGLSNKTELNILFPGAETVPSLEPFLTFLLENCPRVKHLNLVFVDISNEKKQEFENYAPSELNTIKRERTELTFNYIYLTKGLKLDNGIGDTYGSCSTFNGSTDLPQTFHIIYLEHPDIGEGSFSVFGNNILKDNFNYFPKILAPESIVITSNLSGIEATLTQDILKYILEPEQIMPFHSLKVNRWDPISYLDEKSYGHITLFKPSKHIHSPNLDQHIQNCISKIKANEMLVKICLLGSVLFFMKFMAEAITKQLNHTTFVITLLSVSVFFWQRYTDVNKNMKIGIIVLQALAVCASLYKAAVDEEFPDDPVNNLYNSLMEPSESNSITL